MNVLVIDSGLCGAALCLRLAQEGHIVSWFLEPKESNKRVLEAGIGDGLHKNVKKVTDWKPIAAKSDLIISTENGNFLPQLERLREKGIPVWAPSQKVADLEIKRADGLKFFEKHGLNVPEYMKFKTLKEAEAYVMENPARYVFKTLGDNEDKSLSFVGKSAQELVQQLRMWQENGMNPKGEVILQKFVEGIEFSVSAMVGANGFVGPFMECFENKKLFAGNKGPNTGEMGSTLKYVRKSKLGETILRPLEEDLVKMGAFCNFDLNTIIDEKGKPWILEATARWGWPETNIQLLLHDNDLAEWIVDACEGKDSFKPSMDVGMGAVLVLPDFPNDTKEKHENAVGIPLYGVTDKNEKHIQPQYVRLDKYVDEVDGELEETDGYVSTGTYVAVVVNEGRTITEAQDGLYEIIDDLSMSNLGYRNDIGEREMEAIPELQKHGYAEEWKV